MYNHLLIAGAIFGMASGTIANKFLFRYVDPALFTSLRFLVSGLLIAGGLSLSAPRKTLERATLLIVPLLLITLLTNFVPAQLKAYALATILSSKLALIGCLDPFVTALYSRILYGQLLTWRQFLGMLIGVSGVAIVIYGQQSTPIDQIAFGGFSWGELAAIAWLLLQRLGWLQAQKLLKGQQISARELNACTMLMGGILGLAWTFSRTASINSLVYTCIRQPITITAITAMVYTVVVGNIIGYNLYAHVLSKFSANYVQMAFLCLPPSMFILGWLVLNEPLYPSFLIAMPILACGMYIFYSKDTTHTSAV